MFKKNSPELKILLGTIIATFVITILGMLTDAGNFRDIPLIFGITALGIGLLEILLGIILLIAGDGKYGKGFLLCAGLLLLLSGISCSIGFGNM